MRRRNGKRGKGMATKKEKTKEQRIKTEKTRLKGIFKDLDENKRKLVTPLIEKAAFMSIELDDFFMPRGRLEYLQATDGVPYDI